MHAPPVKLFVHKHILLELFVLFICGSNVGAFVRWSVGGENPHITKCFLVTASPETNHGNVQSGPILSVGCGTIEAFPIDGL